MAKNLTIGNKVVDSSEISLDLSDISNFDVSIQKFFKRIDVTLETNDVLFQSDFDKLAKYFEKYDYKFSSIYSFHEDLILTYIPIKESE